MSDRTPELSVLIATHDRREMLLRCLGELDAQTLSAERFEIVVAIDGSTDGTAAAVRELALGPAVEVLELPKTGKAGVLNAAIEAARGDVCLFLDDDVIPSAGLVGEHLAAHLADRRTIGIGALTQVAPKRRDPYAETFAANWNARYAGLEAGSVDWGDVYGGNFSAPRADLLAVGGIDPELPAIEDLELGYRLWRHGCTPRYLPAATAVHDDDKPGAKVLAAEERYGAFCSRFVRKHPGTRRKLLGWFNEATAHEVLLRRLAIALRVPPARLVPLGNRLPRGARDLWFGFVHRYAFWHGALAEVPRAERRQLLGGVPVLMYHAFTAGEERDRWVVPGDTFARQMRLLALLRYRVITLDELAAALRAGGPLPRRGVVITIDDGYRDNLEVALPLLRRHRFPASLFLVSRRVGEANDWDTEGAPAGRPILGDAEIAELRAGGVHLGAHTRTHPVLSQLDDEQVREEIGGSRRDLEERLGEPIETLTYPFGVWDDRSLAATAEAGFLAACTTEARLTQTGDDPLLIPRIEIGGSDSILTFLRKVWMGGF